MKYWRKEEILNDGVVDVKCWYIRQKISSFFICFGSTTRWWCCLWTVGTLYVRDIMSSISFRRRSFHLKVWKCHSTQLLFTDLSAFTGPTSYIRQKLYEALLVLTSRKSCYANRFIYCDQKNSIIRFFTSFALCMYVLSINFQNFMSIATRVWIESPFNNNLLLSINYNEQRMSIS